MPFPFTLPTTSSVLLSDFFDSATHPSLPLAATTKRSVLKDALKKHKRLQPHAQEGHLTIVRDSIANYLPFLLALNAGSGYRDIDSERLDVIIKKPLEVEWRRTLSSSQVTRSRLIGLHHELAFTFLTLANVHSLLARTQLKTLQGISSLSVEHRTAAISTAMKHLLEAHSLLTHLLSLPSVSAARDAPVDIQPSTVSALASLALAEATIVVVAKDDPYVAAIADERDDSNNEWMYKPRSIPKVRAHLYARICLASSEHAASASGLLSRGSAGGTGKVNEDLVKYANDLRKTSRAKAARFLAIDAELSGRTGEALAWLKGARKELVLTAELEDGKRKGLKGFKQSWQERREDLKVEKGGEWGLDAGKFEEARVVEMLEAKWDRENNTVNVQLVPEFTPLLANMPSGREYHAPRPYEVPTLSPDTFASMRAPPEPNEAAYRGEEEDSGGEDELQASSNPVGAFPGTRHEYGRSATGPGYY